ncbi:imm11 family protein [Myxococcus sp. RHSTA-1-4]|uniref:imm11 family protein n=1 Tax=Myxococcus sp. RHSTA-1-4 TaxID=2874601 RepID=UPI001CBF6D4C|nr:DUF1629 domain-containing protein [Myxococcus sp. RHSTA-1-4]MBZ4418652.1 hypothetical protein [Myxococcus sp. RHSTA-1-4]
MAPRYFELSDDVYLPGRWELGKLTDAEGGKEVWPWLLKRGEPAHFPKRPVAPIRSPGRPLDFSHAAFGIPVVHARAASIFTELAPADVQLIPVSIEGQSDPYFILNVIRIVKCIADKASAEVRYWTEEDGLPEKVGKYSSVSGMRIDPTKVGDAKVFRTWGWHVALIVFVDINEALERAGATGVKFKEVTGPGQVLNRV